VPKARSQNYNILVNNSEINQTAPSRFEGAVLCETCALPKYFMVGRFGSWVFGELELEFMGVRTEKRFIRSCL